MSDEYFYSELKGYRWWFSRRSRKKKRNPSDQEIIELLRGAYIKSGLTENQVLTVEMYNKSGAKPKQVSLTKMTGKPFSELCRMAGIPCHSCRTLSNEEVLELLRQGNELLGERFNYENFSKLNLGISAPSVVYRFGTWGSACKLAGVPVGKYNRKTVDPIPALKSHIRSLGYVPLRIHYKGPPALNTLKVHGFTYESAILAAGYNFEKSIKTGKLVRIRDHLKGNQRRRDYFRERENQKRRSRIEAGLCPQCGKEWTEPEETHRGKPRHCLGCQKYFKERRMKKK